MASISESINCAICFEPVKGSQNITFVNCKHGNCVHAECIVRWKHNTCPLCRAVIYDESHTIHKVHEYINNERELINQEPKLVNV